MLRFLADENFRTYLRRGLLRQDSQLDILRVQDAGLSGYDDEQLLEWASQQQRVILTHDVQTMPGHAFARVRKGQPMSGVLVIAQAASPAKVIFDVLLIVECYSEMDCRDQVQFLPL